jgi:alcohol dehydrogenase
MASMDFDFTLNTNAKFGSGRALNLGKYLQEMSFQRPGIIIDKGIADTPYVNKVIDSVKDKKFEELITWIYDIGAEPDYDSLDQIKLHFMDKHGNPNVDCFVGIGGGSVIEFAKGLATVVINPGNAIQYRGFPTGIKRPLPTIAIPTTAGTGSEVTYNAVFIDWKEKKKLGINTTLNFPILAILDPQFTISCPQFVTVSSGMDALVHAIGSYASPKSSPLTRLFAREAFSRLFDNLYNVIDHPDNLEIRANIQYGAYLASVSLMNSSSDPAGALSYPLGVEFKVPHGIAGGVFLPHVIEHNVNKGFDYSELYYQILKARPGLPVDERNRHFSELMFELCNKLKVPTKLHTFGITESNVDVLLKAAEMRKAAFDLNPVEFSVDDAKKLLLKLVK